MSGENILPMHYDGGALPSGARFAVALAILIAHVFAAWLLLQIPSVRHTIAEASPVFARLIVPAPPKQVPVEIPPVVEPLPKPKPKPKPKVKEPPPVVKKEEAPAMNIPVAPEPEPEPVVEPVSAPPPVAQVVAEAPPPLPKTVSVSAVRYREAPKPVYPNASRRMKEEGEVVVRVLIDVNGKAQQWEMMQSSGKDRLDEAAITAVKRASFYPYRENDAAMPVWVIIPVSFSLGR